jgi:cell division septum initiation protein DivIVA
MNVVVPINPDFGESEAARAAQAAVTEVSDLVDTLNNRLEAATKRIAELKVERTELELGHLFSRAQEFVDSTTTKANEQAQRIIGDAHQEAIKVLAAARVEAAQIVEEARRSSVPSPEVIQQLNQAIDGFLTVNKQLVLELGYLRTMAAGGNQTPSSQG